MPKTFEEHMRSKPVENSAIGGTAVAEESQFVERHELETLRSELNSVLDSLDNVGRDELSQLVQELSSERNAKDDALQAAINTSEGRLSDEIKAVRQFSGLGVVQSIGTLELLKLLSRGESVPENAFQKFSKIEESLEELAMDALDDGVNGVEFTRRLEAKFPNQKQLDNAYSKLPGVMEKIRENNELNSEEATTDIKPALEVKKSIEEEQEDDK